MFLSARDRGLYYFCRVGDPAISVCEGSENLRIMPARGGDPAIPVLRWFETPRRLSRLGHRHPLLLRPLHKPCAFSELRAAHPRAPSPALFQVLIPTPTFLLHRAFLATQILTARMFSPLPGTLRAGSPVCMRACVNRS